MPSDGNDYIIMIIMSHLENNRDISVWYIITRLLSRAKLLCFLTRSKTWNPGIDTQMMHFAVFILYDQV